MSWMLINVEDITALQSGIDNLAEHVAPELVDLVKGLRHRLDTSLHVTDAIPTDYQNSDTATYEIIVRSTTSDVTLIGGVGYVLATEEQAKAMIGTPYAEGLVIHEARRVR